MDRGLILALVGLTVAGLASLLGIWMERDPNRPPRWAIGLSILIAAATIVSCFQSIADAEESAKTEEDLARMLQTLDKIASDQGGENPALKDFLSNEMAAQSRSNPDVIKRVADRVSAEGGDANAVLARNLPPSELGGFPAAKAAAPAQPNNEEAKKLRAELASVKQDLNNAKAASAEAEAAKKNLEKLQQDHKEAQDKIEDLNGQLEKLKKQNEKIKSRSGGSRWEKG